MSGTNQIVPFAAGAGANVESTSAWLADAVVGLGFQSGIASAAKVNKALRQSSAIAAMVAQFVADNQASNISDDASTASLEALFYSALVNYIGGSVQAGIWEYVVATKSGDTYTITPTPTLTARTIGMVLRVKFPSANTTTAPSIVDGIGTTSLLRSDGSAPSIGDFVGTRSILWNGSAYQAASAMLSESTATAINTLISNAELSQFTTASGGAYTISNGGFTTIVTSDAPGTTRLTNNGSSGFTINQAGLYAITLGATVNISVTGVSFLVGQVRLFKNGTLYGLPAVLSGNVNGSGNYSFSPSITYFVRLAAGDVLVPYAGAAATANFNVANWNNPFISFQKVV